MVFAAPSLEHVVIGIAPLVNFLCVNPLHPTSALIIASGISYLIRTLYSPKVSVTPQMRGDVEPSSNAAKQGPILRVGTKMTPDPMVSRAARCAAMPHYRPQRTDTGNNVYTPRYYVSAPSKLACSSRCKSGSGKA